MKATLEELLELTNLVFDGKIKRAELARRYAYEQVFVATAIMLVARHLFLEKNNAVREPYGITLERLLSTGTVNHWAGKKGFKSGGVLSTAARQSFLCESRANTIFLTPPRELAELVYRRCLTPAITTFLNDAMAGLTQDKKWEAEYRARGARGVRRNYIAQVVDEVQKRFGHTGLRELQAQITEQLKGQ